MDDRLGAGVRGILFNLRQDKTGETRGATTQQCNAKAGKTYEMPGPGILLIIWKGTLGKSPLEGALQVDSDRFKWGEGDRRDKSTTTSETGKEWILRLILNLVGRARAVNESRYTSAIKAWMDGEKEMKQ